MKLTEAIKKNIDKLVFESDVQRDAVIAAKEVTLTPDDSETTLDELSNLIKVPYQDESIKKRAQTIGLAYNIYFKLLLSAITVHKYTLFAPYLEETKVDELIADLPIELREHFLLTVNKVKKFDKNTSIIDLQTKEELSSLSVTLAWLKSKHDSTYWPQDLTVMEPTSPIHKLLTDEVNALTILDSQLVLLKDVYKRSEIKDFEFDAVIKDEQTGLSASVDISFLTEFDGNSKQIYLDIKTTEKLPEPTKHDTTNLKAIKYLKEVTQAPLPWLEYGYLNYFVRYDLLVEYK